ncbi:MAG: IS4 family transposase [Ferrovibrio sp.]|uniref:IS4 family transposase n=1 Tax=Ferrovibrio sp. TaxID=1917215 RepID=UPI00260CAB87|nr:IS4 family transposase [Ferrovibrio sp.]MCW0233210.1 IS4 family transposase [Ferrovibrio sp.]
MSGDMEAGGVGWHEAEVASAGLPDKRLARRLQRLLDQMSASPGQPVPAACGDWAATKAAYRFFDNPRVTEHGVLAGHFAATAMRCAASEEPILILQDTTEFIYNRARPGKIGFTKTINAGHYKAGQPNVVTLCGMLMHSSLAVTVKGTPLGLTAAKFWTRTKFKGTLALKRHVNPTRVPIEEKESYRWLENLRQSMALVGAPERCVHVADRESDIYELFCLAQDLGTRFLVRVQTNRLAAAPADAEPEHGAHRVFAQLAAAPWTGRHCVRIGQDETACVHVKFAAIETLPPVGKQKRYSPQLLTYIQALAIDPPADRPPIDWKLVTNLPVGDLAAAVEKLEWYALRWKAEVFHKVMKSGCRAEESRLETAERLAKFLALIAVISWRIFFLTMSARAKPEAEPETVLTPAEIATLESIDAARAKPRILRRTFATYLIQIAMLGGYLARNHDPPPGNVVVWRGLSRLNDIALGIAIGTRRKCG